MNNKINYQFVALPLQCLNLGANELKLFAILFNLSGKYANEEGYFFHSQKKLCNMMGYTERYTRTITHNLEQIGIITVRRHNDGGRNASYGQAHEYKINMDAVLNITPQKQGVISEQKHPVKGGTIVPPSNKENVTKGGTIVPPSKEKNDPEKAEQNDKKGGTIVPKKAEQNDLPIENEDNIGLKEIEKENRKEKENEAVTATVKTATDEFIEMLEDCDRQDEEKKSGKTPSVKVEEKVNDERMNENDKTTDGEPTEKGITSTERMEEEQNQTSTQRVEGISTGGQDENTISHNEGINSSTGTTGQDTPNESNVLLTAADERQRDSLKQLLENTKIEILKARTREQYAANTDNLELIKGRLREMLPTAEYGVLENDLKQWWDNQKRFVKWANEEQALQPSDTDAFDNYTKAMKTADTAERAEQCVTALRRYTQILKDKYTDAQPIIEAYKRCLEQAKNDNPIMREYIDAM